PGRTRWILSRKSLFPELSRVLCRWKPLPTPGQRQRSISGRVKSTWALGKRTIGRHEGRKYRGSVHQLRPAGNGGLLVGHDRLQRYDATGASAADRDQSGQSTLEHQPDGFANLE